MINTLRLFGDFLVDLCLVFFSRNDFIRILILQVMYIPLLLIIIMPKKQIIYIQQTIDFFPCSSSNLVLLDDFIYPSDNRYEEVHHHY